MEKIEKPKRATSAEAKKSLVGIRLSLAERAELQAGADLAAGGNLGLYIRTLTLASHRRPPYQMLPLCELMPEVRNEALEDAAKQVECLFGVGAHPADQYAAQAEYARAVRALKKNPAQAGRENVERGTKKAE